MSDVSPSSSSRPLNLVPAKYSSSSFPFDVDGGAVVTHPACSVLLAGMTGSSCTFAVLVPGRPTGLSGGIHGPGSNYRIPEGLLVVPLMDVKLNAAVGVLASPCLSPLASESECRPLDPSVGPDNMTCPRACGEQGGQNKKRKSEVEGDISIRLHFL